MRKRIRTASTPCPFSSPAAIASAYRAQGFRAVSRAGVQLEVAQTAALDFTLDVGAASESITVTDSAPLLDSGSNAIGGLVTSEKVEDLPLLGRNSNALVMLVPGIRATRQTTVNPVLESHYQFFSINGSRPNQNQFMLDGGNNTNLTFNGPEYSPQVEEVQEFRIQTSNFSAEYANSGGGVINVVSKSGTSAMAQRLFRDFDTSVFSFNAPFTFGNAPRLVPNLRSPGVANFDMSLFKNTSINERLRVQFRVEAFNVFNRVQFGVPNTSINSSVFGVISSQQNSPRNYQLGMRLLF